MQDFEHQINEKVQRYLREVRSEEYSIQEIERRPRWKRVWFYWKALEYYDREPFPDLTLKEVKDIYGDK